MLGSSRGYAGFLRLIRADRFLEVFATESLHLAHGQRLLDLGCGNGALAAHLDGVDYTGIDHNPAYIDAAQREHGGTGRRFVCADLAELAVTERGTFDAVCAVGVLHHLEDDLASSVISTALQMLVPGGRLVTIDPVFHPHQRAIARVRWRWIAANSSVTPSTTGRCPRRWCSHGGFRALRPQPVPLHPLPDGDDARRVGGREGLAAC